MAIQIVGTPQGGSNTNGGDVTLTFDVAPREGDVVYVFGCHTDRAPTFNSGPSTSGYTEIARVTGASALDFSVFRKVMGSSPDTDVVCKGTGSASDACSYACYVLRGVDTTTPEDVAESTAGPTIGGQPNCASIDPVTPGCLILALMGNRVTDAAITAPAGYTNTVTSTGNDLVDTSVYGGVKQLPNTGHAAEDPGATTGWLEGNFWCAVTVAVRPIPYIAYKSAGAGVSSETSGVSLSPACPATVDANDILIAHVYWEGTTDAPSTPSGWTLLGSSPYVIESTVARHWVFGKIADGSEDGAAVTFATTPATTNQRGARIYSFDGLVSGTLADLVVNFAHQSDASWPKFPSLTTTIAGGLAVALIGQNDNNTHNHATSETGGNYTIAVASYNPGLTPGFAMTLQTCTPTDDPGTVSGAEDVTNVDPAGVIVFEIRPSVPVAPSGQPAVKRVGGVPFASSSIVGSSGTRMW